MVRKVLVVSPEADLRAQREAWLQAAGFHTEAVASFEEARARLGVGNFDALVTDVRLNGYNGLHLAIVGLNRRFTRAAVAIGPSDAALAKEAKYHGAGFLSDPCTCEELIDCLRNHLQTQPRRTPVEKRKRRVPGQLRTISRR